jgi:hypothetical protein
MLRTREARLVAVLALCLCLAGCEEYHICGNAAQPNCCKISTGGSNTVTYCVASCQQCSQNAAGKNVSCPSIASGWYDTDTGASGCVTDTRKKTSIFGENEPNFSRPQLIRVSATSNPLDCEAICVDKNSAFCTSAGLDPTVRDHLQTFEARIQRTRRGSISMDQVHSMFKIPDGADTCKRNSVSLAPDSITNSGAGSCQIQTLLGMGKKEVNLSIEIPARLRGQRSRDNSGFSLAFGDTSESANLKIDDAYLDQKYGGQIKHVIVRSNRAYFATPNACIMLSMDGS